MTPAFLEGLNPEQYEAVTAPKCSALILAGAGSGKTRVLTTRIAYLIETGQVSPGGVLAVTFTNKAAREMMTRLSAMLPINVRGMWVGTFHGLCNRLLRTHHREARLPQTFQILDSQDQLAMIKRMLKALNVDDEKYPPKQLQNFINNAKDSGLRASDVEAHDDFTAKFREWYALYDAQCQREGVVDFAELLLRCFEMLSRDAMLRDHYRSRFQHILVDEFQDTNRLQYLWLRMLAGDACAVFAVGDDDQSIYAFRGARASNMDDFLRDFHIDRVIKLEQNYRSFGNILNAANALIRNNERRLGKNLWTAAGSGEQICVFEATSDFDEVNYIVDEIKAIHREGVRLSDIALLYRSNAQSRVLEHGLFGASLAYRVYGGLRFFERQEIKHALAYLRLIANPEDDGALLRVINFPPRGIGARSLEQLQDSAVAQHLSLYRAARSGLMSGKAGASVKAFTDRIETMREICAAIPLPEQIDHVLDASGLLAHYRANKQDADRVENLEELINAASGFVQENAAESLNDFLVHAALEAGDHQAAESQDALQLMTVHAAKGLEFDTVFISGLEEGLFPHENSLYERDGLEEERRLMYVAITRARSRLYLSHAQSRMLHGQSRFGVASRFLSELPEPLLRRISVQVSPKYAAPGLSNRWASPQTAASSAWRIGQNVIHPKFGAGVIVQYEGGTHDARVQVNFREVGVKWLALEYAKLVPV